MLNIVDLIIAALALFYLLKNAGGITKTIKNFLIVILALVFFGIIATFLTGFSLPKSLHKTLENSYFVKLSHYIIKWTYPTVEKGAPKFDNFIKEKILSAPTPEVSIPKAVTLEKTKKEQEKRLKELLEDENLGPSTPSGKAR